MAEKVPKDVVTAPDPEEDDLDDLDDVLDEFQATSITQPTPKAPAAATSGPERPPAASASDTKEGPPKDAVPSEDEFAKELQTSMTNLISELDQNPDMQKEFEKMMQELIAAGAVSNDAEPGSTTTIPAAPSTAKPTAPSSSSSSSSAKKSGAPEDKFQDTIRKTMERMQASGDAATAASTSKQSQTSEDALLEQMMASLMEGGAGAGGEGGEGDFNAMLMSMMTQLTHKEILYEPMKELNDKFPAWMTKNAATAPKDDLARFQKQQKLVGEIVGRFERSGYSDNNEADREYIVERMQEMQSAGSPPEDLVGDMAAAQEALGDLDSSCPTQ